MATKKVIEGEELKQYYPVFRVKTLGYADSCMVKYLGIIKNDDKLQDEAIELDDQHNNTQYICRVGEYDVTAKMYWCNIIAEYLLKNPKLPVCYMSVSYDRKFVSGGLCAYFLYFTISEESLSEIKKPNNYINKVVKGTYTYELVTDKGLLEDFLSSQSSTIQENIMKKYVDEFETNPSETIQKIDEEHTQKIKSYQTMFQPAIVTKSPNKNNIIKHMMNLKTDSNFIDILKYSLSMREKERYGKLGNDIENTIPQNIIKLNQVRNNPDYIVPTKSDSDDESSDSETM